MSGSLSLFDPDTGVRTSPTRQPSNGHREDPEFCLRILSRADALHRMAASLVREAEDLKRELMGKSGPHAKSVTVPVDELQPGEVFDITPQVAAHECNVHVTTIERLCRRLRRSGETRNKRGGRLYLSRQQLNAYKAGQL